MFYFLPKGSRHSNQTRRLGKASCGPENAPGVEQSRGNRDTKEYILPANRWRVLTETSRLANVYSRKVACLIF